MQIHTRQIFRPVEIRELDSEGDRIVTGRIVEFNKIENVGKWREQFKTGVFGSIENRDDIICNLNHDRSKLLGRSGANLEFIQDDKGVTATLNLAPYTENEREAISQLGRKILRGFSIEFVMKKYHTIAGVVIHELATLTGLALVANPALSAARDVSMRDDYMFNFDPPYDHEFRTRCREYSRWF